MDLLTGFLLLCCLCGLSQADLHSVNNIPFPKDFKFGVATAAYQIEGGWDADGKGENIWDYITHTFPTFIIDSSNGDVACDSYNKYKEDVKILKDLGVHFYRFSIGWTRIFPSGYINQIDMDGVQYYKDLIKQLKENNIEPFVTLYHWDLPQVLQRVGGWANPLIIDNFVDYARRCFELFGDDVKYWVTINEPKQICEGGYGLGAYAPGVQSNGLAEYWCTHNILKAHARVWHMYNDEFRRKQKGKISITVDSFWYEPASNSTADIEAAETNQQFALGWFLNPIFNGNYPKVMIDRVALRSKGEGFSKSRLPKFTPEELKYIKGTHDFLGFNYYTSGIARAQPEPRFTLPSWVNDIGVLFYQPTFWAKSTADWLKATPWGFRKMLNWIKKTYNNPEIMITENGFPENAEYSDYDRVNYYKGHLSNLRDAMHYDKVKITAYMAWSVLDNFEWGSGYTQRFGLYYVNMQDPNRPRTPKMSAKFFKNLIKTHVLEGNFTSIGPRRSGSSPSFSTPSSAGGELGGPGEEAQQPAQDSYANSLKQVLAADFPRPRVN